MQEQNQKVTEDIVNFVVTLEKRTDVIGYLYYNTLIREWNFEYHQMYKESRFTPISSLPELDRRYSHMETVTWLTSRVSEKTKEGDFHIDVRDYVKLKDNKNISYRLEIHHLQ